MDTLSTAIGGALLAKALPREKRGPSAVGCVTLSSALPDADMFAELFVHDPLSTLTHHRAFTHSMVGAAVMSPLIALAFWRFGKDKNYARLLALALFGLTWHMFTDLATSWGTMVFYPFNRDRVVWDLIFIIDFVFSSVLLVPQLLAWVYRDRARAARRGGLIGATMAALTAFMANVVSQFLETSFPWSLFALLVLLEAGILLAPAIRGWGFAQDSTVFARGGVAALAIYLTVCTISHTLAVGRVRQVAREDGLVVRALAALPQPLSPFRWSGLVLTPAGVYQGWLNVLDGERLRFEFFPSDENGYVERARQLPDVRTYLWFARFPVARYRQAAGRNIVEYADVRFRGPVGRDVSFVYRVVLGADGEVISRGFVNP